MGETRYKNAIIYALDVESFLDSDGDGIGDFEGLTRCLDYLSGLGVTCTWLLPFYPSPNRDDGYDVAGYYDVDPRLGTLGDFVEFIREARDRGIQVVADLVVNHTSDQHPWFQAARRDRTSRYRDYYVWADNPPLDSEEGVVFPGEQAGNWAYDSEAGAYYWHWFYQHQPDLNTGNPRVLEEIRRIMGFWLELGVSGFRLDAAPFLVRPVVSGGEYGYERVNVDAQRLDPGSLLNFTARLIRTRKECPELGWGEPRILETGDPRVLAHRCEWRGGVVVAVHNLSREACAVTLDLSEEDARHAVDLLGDRRAEPLDGGRHPLRLDGYGFRWLRIHSTRHGSPV